jgi:hypothetical protein
MKVSFEGDASVGTGQAVEKAFTCRNIADKMSVIERHRR